MSSKNESQNNLIRALDYLANIPSDEAKKMYSSGRINNIAQGEYFIRAGDIPKTFAFVSSGLFRYVYIDEEGRQFTKAFMPEFSISNHG